MFLPPKVQEVLFTRKDCAEGINARNDDAKGDLGRFGRQQSDEAGRRAALGYRGDRCADAKP